MTSPDVFISYAHVDNEALLDDQEGWITIFQRALQKRLSQLLGRVSCVWLDRRRLAGNYYFDETIATAVERAPLMLSIVSPRYLKSDYCRKEVTHFAATREIKVSDRSRLFTCIKTPVARDNLFPEMAGKLGYEFFRPAEQVERFREFSVYDPESKPLFMMALEDVAQDMCRLLNELGALPVSAPPPRAASTPPPVSEPVALASTESSAPRQCVFVATCSADVKGVRDGLVRELAAQQRVVTPEQGWSENAAGFERELLQAVSGASLSVHLLGTGYGTIPEDAESSYPVLQFERVKRLAAERPQELPLVRLLWTPRELQVTSEKQRKFLELVRNDPNLGPMDELLEGSEEELKERIVAKLDALEKLRRQREEDALRAAQAAKRDSKRPSSIPPPMLGPVKKVYVISSQLDQPEQVMEIERTLDEQGFDVISSVELAEEESEAAREARHQSWLEQCDGCLIFHGGTKVSWVRAQIDEVRKVTGRRPHGPMSGHAIYVAPPLDGLKLRYQVHFPKLEGRSSPPGDLRPFIVQMSEQERTESGEAGQAVVGR
jgi:TIR domain